MCSTPYQVRYHEYGGLRTGAGPFFQGADMAVKVGINGYGRIGRNILRALYESGRTDIEIGALNDLGDAEAKAYLTRHATAHGPSPHKVEVEGGHLIIEGDKIHEFAVRNAGEIEWKDFGVDVVLEC